MAAALCWPPSASIRLCRSKDVWAVHGMHRAVSSSTWLVASCVCVSAIPCTGVDVHVPCSQYSDGGECTPTGTYMVYPVVVCSKARMPVCRMSWCMADRHASSHGAGHEMTSTTNADDGQSLSEAVLVVGGWMARENSGSWRACEVMECNAEWRVVCCEASQWPQGNGRGNGSRLVRVGASLDPQNFGHLATHVPAAGECGISEYQVRRRRVPGVASQKAKCGRAGIREARGV